MSDKRVLKSVTWGRYDTYDQRAAEHLRCMLFDYLVHPSGGDRDYEPMPYEQRVQLSTFERDRGSFTRHPGDVSWHFFAEGVPAHVHQWIQDLYFKDGTYVHRVGGQFIMRYKDD